MLRVSATYLTRSEPMWGILQVPWYEQAGLPKWWTDDEPADIVDRSGKLAVAMTILQDAATRNEKTLLFSQCLGTLNLFEKVSGTGLCKHSMRARGHLIAFCIQYHHH